jgi:uncharacterized protein (TIGR02145 family)
VSSDSSNGTIEYATSHPTTFITENYSLGDWYYTGSSSTDNTRWTTSDKSKSVYDPCPAGWRVPDGGSNGVWSKALGSSSSFDYTYNSTNKGMDFSGKFSNDQTIWYPASGCLSLGGGSLSSVGNRGYYWSASPYSDFACRLAFLYSGSVSPSLYDYRAFGLSVRCFKDESGNGSGGSEVVISYIIVDETADNNKSSLTIYESSQWWASFFSGLSVSNQYELACWDKSSDLVMVFDSPYASYKIFDYDFNEVSADKSDNFWLKFTGFAQNSKGRVVMDPELFDNENVIETGNAPESFIVFYDETGKVLAGVCCKYTSASGSAAAFELSVMQGEARISTLSPETELYRYLAGNLSVSTIFKVEAAGDAIFQLSQPLLLALVCDMSFNISTAVTSECLSQNCFFVSPHTAAEVVIVLKDEMYVNVAAIHYTYTALAEGSSY